MEISTMGGASFNTVKNTGSIDVSGNDGDLAVVANEVVQPCDRRLTPQG
jgi:hypothetical protein